MKRSHFAILAALALVTAPALATTVTVHIGDPGYYGPVTVAGYPRPQLVYAEPVIVQRVQVVHEPVYIRVPVVQQQNWRTYCGRYNACNRPVYFVEDTWYRDVYAPQYRQRYGRTQSTTYQQPSTTYQQRSTTYEQQRLATKQAEVNRKMDREQEKVAEKTRKEQQKLAEKTEKEQEKLAKKAEKEQKKLDKKNHG
jgi:hypothetical protein